jgi:hypothetical protein
MIFDWVNEDEVPIELMEPLEFFMRNILLLDPEKSSAFFDTDNLCVEYNGLIIKLPKRMKDRYAEIIHKRKAAGW